MNFHTDKGHAGEHYVTGDLTLKGYVVLHPILPNTPFDLVVYDGKEFVKVQVKTGTFNDVGKLFVYLRKKNESKYTESDYDVLAVFETSSKQIAYLPFSEKTKLTFTSEGRRGTVSLRMQDFTRFPERGISK
jgi:Holliday junction resolvase-like predicted endonuclease